MLINVLIGQNIVKSNAKPITMDNLTAKRPLNTDNAVAAILHYRNTHLPNWQLNSSQIPFHCQLRDQIPYHPSH